MSQKHNNEPQHNGDARTHSGVLSESLRNMRMSMRALYRDYTETSPASIEAPAEAPQPPVVDSNVYSISTGQQIAPFTGIVKDEATGLDGLRSTVAEVHNQAPVQDLRSLIEDAT